VTLRSHAATPFEARPRLPGDKSITHRAYLLAALAEGRYRLRNPNRGEDCCRTLAAVQALGVEGTVRETEVELTGAGGALRPPGGPLDLGNSGTGLRLILGVLAGTGIPATVTGDASLRARPMERVAEPLRRMGATVETTGGGAPVRVAGAVDHPIRYRLPVPSAQVKSAILFAALRVAGTTRVLGGAGSRDHTERLLRHFGAPVESTEEEVSLVGPTALGGRDLEVPGDPSAAMFYLVAAAILPGSRVVLERVGLNPTRVGGFSLLQAMGLGLERPPAGSEAEPLGTVVGAGRGLRGIRVGPEAVAGAVDELPALAVAAAFAEGTTVVSGAGELRHKESDRLSTVAAGLRAIGAAVEERPDGWVIEGSSGRPLDGGEVRTEGDHRVAMAFLVAGLRCRRGVELCDEAGIETSDPFFLENLRLLMEHPK